MHVKIEKYFEIAKSYWPDKIDVREKYIYSKSSAKILGLVIAHDKVEEKIMEHDEKIELLRLDWAIYTKLHKQAMNNDFIYPKKLKFSDIEGIYLENLD